MKEEDLIEEGDPDMDSLKKRDSDDQDDDDKNDQDDADDDDDADDYDDYDDDDDDDDVVYDGTKSIEMQAK